jgi:predicted TIM-barrel fold metal-dependent hydrolase
MDAHWRDAVEQRGVDELRSIAYPTHAPLSGRFDWRHDGALPGSSLERLREEALGPFGTARAICNCLYGVQMPFSEDLAAGVARALNAWIAAEWLDREPRLAASIVVPSQSPELAAAEIERWAGDRRFVQVLLLVGGDVPLGRRSLWPIYAAAARHGLPVGIHAGSAYRYPVTPVGWPSHFAEDYLGQAPAFASQLTSLIAEGVFTKLPDLRVVLLESGVTWLPALLWRLTKYWRGLRIEVPWVDRSPAEIVRSHVRLTLQPFDAPPDAATVERIIDQLGSDELLLFSTDYPHAQFEGLAALPAGLSPQLARKIMVDNPLSTYPRLRECVA